MTHNHQYHVTVGICPTPTESALFGIIGAKNEILCEYTCTDGSGLMQYGADGLISVYELIDGGRKYLACIYVQQFLRRNVAYAAPIYGFRIDHGKYAPVTKGRFHGNVHAVGNASYGGKWDDFEDPLYMFFTREFLHNMYKSNMRQYSAYMALDDMQMRVLVEAAQCLLGRRPTFHEISRFIARHGYTTSGRNIGALYVRIPVSYTDVSFM